MNLTEQEIFEAAILVVDDQAVNIELITRTLADTGYRNVSSTMEPQEVCAMHRKSHYDLILLDLQMPGMDGFAVMEGLKTSEIDPYLSVLVVTAQPGHKLRALAAGARDFISKPFDLVELRTRIRNLLEVRLLYKKLAGYNEKLEATVRERTAELRESEARYRSLTELASDWYWEQDENGEFTKVSGPVLEMLGIRVAPLAGGVDANDSAGWNETARATLLATIEARQPFLDFVMSRVDHAGKLHEYHVSGEPMFTQACRFIGYRGLGVERLTHD